MTGRFPADSGVYGILTDPLVGYERLAEIMVESGIRVIQLRMKDRPRAEVVATALKLRALIPPDVVFIINDDPSIVKETGADGVHLGQDDRSYAATRAMLGPSVVIGLSTHNPAQTTAACVLRPDYIGIGPVWPTPTKKCADPALGLETMAEMVKIATVPTVCLGSIDMSNADQVMRAGARMICAVRCINQAEDPASVIARLRAIVDGYLHA